jgi:hypothetical protein
VAAERVSFEVSIRNFSGESAERIFFRFNYGSRSERFRGTVVRVARALTRGISARAVESKPLQRFIKANSLNFGIPATI